MAQRFTKNEFIHKIAKDNDLTLNQAAEVFNNFIDTIKSELIKGHEVPLFGFGNFKVADRKARKTRNPQTGASMTVPAHKVVTFKSSAYLKEAVNK